MYCAESAVKEYIGGTWSLTMKQLLRWCRLAVGPQGTADGEGKDYPFLEKGTTYWRMSLGHHQSFFYWLMDSLSGTDEGNEKDMRLCKVLSRQVIETCDVVKSSDDDVMVRKIGYDGKRNAHVDEYYVDERRREMGTSVSGSGEYVGPHSDCRGSYFPP